VRHYQIRISIKRVVVIIVDIKFIYKPEEDSVPQILSRYFKISNEASSTVIMPDVVGQCARVSSPLFLPTTWRHHK